jgi:uncharacterized OB-fold protein
MSTAANALSQLIDITPLNEPYWRSLAEGRLIYQRCRSCGHAWLPARSQCPQCLSDDREWAAASGKARLVSWIVYHHAYHDSVADRLPYTVAVVELDEGPRLTSNVVDSGDPEKLTIDQQLTLKIEREGNLFVPRFVAVPRQAPVETTA